jgi:hypothetical protein
MVGTKKTRALELAETEARLEGVPKGGSTRTGMTDAEKTALEAAGVALPLGIVIKGGKAVGKGADAINKILSKRKAEKALKPAQLKTLKNVRKTRRKRAKETARKRKREGMTDEEKLMLGLSGMGLGTYAALRVAVPDPLSGLKEMYSNNQEEAKKNKKEKTNKNKGGYVKKYAKGGGVRKVRT